MKTITLTLDDEVYDQAVKACEQSRRTLPELFRDLMRSWRGLAREKDQVETALSEIWALADSMPQRDGSAGPLNRDSLYERGLSRH